MRETVVGYFGALHVENPRAAEEEVLKLTWSSTHDRAVVFTHGDQRIESLKG